MELRRGGAGMRFVLPLICLVIALASMPSFAQQSESSIDFDLAYLGKYVWRGLVANPDPVAQPSLTMAWESGLSFNLWGSMDTTDISGARGKFTEINYTLNYDWEADGIDGSAGVIYYDFPNTGDPGTAELFASIGLGGDLDTALSLFWDVAEAQGMYMSLSSGTSTPIGGKPLHITGSLGMGSSGYNDAYFGRAKWALVDATFTAEMPLSTSGNWSLTPTLVFSSLLDGSLRKAVDDPDNLLLGVTASASF